MEQHDLDIEVEIELDEQSEVAKGYTLVIYNDDFNTFEFVIESLIKLCNHNLIQAEQCTMLIHYKGKCGVKEGEFKKLKPICDAFLERGITAKIEQLK